MKLQPRRFTVRGLACVVAVTGIVLRWGAWMHRRSAFFQSEAARHLEVWLVHSPTSPYRRDPRPAYHADMSVKYEQVARYPWLPVAPDPPEPD